MSERSFENTISPAALDLYQQYMHEPTDARTLMNLLRSPDFRRDLEVSDWQQHIPTSMREKWSILPWDTRVGAYLVAWAVAAHQQGLALND